MKGKGTLLAEVGGEENGNLATSSASGPTLDTSPHFASGYLDSRSMYEEPA
jgi:hypothetical protein